MTDPCFYIPYRSDHRPVRRWCWAPYMGSHLRPVRGRHNDRDLLQDHLLPGCEPDQDIYCSVYSATSKRGVEQLEMVLRYLPYYSGRVHATGLILASLHLLSRPSPVVSVCSRSIRATPSLPRHHTARTNPQRDSCRARYDLAVRTNSHPVGYPDESCEEVSTVLDLDRRWSHGSWRSATTSTTTRTPRHDLGLCGGSGLDMSRSGIGDRHSIATCFGWHAFKRLGSSHGKYRHLISQDSEHQLDLWQTRSRFRGVESCATSKTWTLRVKRRDH